MNEDILNVGKELLLCPFCLGIGHLRTHEELVGHHYVTYFQIQCESYGAAGPWDTLPEAAISDWNGDLMAEKPQAKTEWRKG